MVSSSKHLVMFQQFIDAVFMFILMKGIMVKILRLFVHDFFSCVSCEMMMFQPCLQVQPTAASFGQDMF